MSRAIAIPDDEIRAAVANRIPASVLAKKYGCTESTISNHGRKLGLVWHGRAATPA